MTKNTLNYLSKLPMIRIGSAHIVRTSIELLKPFSIAVFSVAVMTIVNVANALTQEQKVAVLTIITSNHLARSIPPDGVCVYTETRFRGYRQCFTDSIVKLNDKLNNQVSSITVSSEYKVTIYQDENYGGGFLSYQADSETIESIDNSVTSVAVAAIGDATAANNQVNPNDTDLDGVNDIDDVCKDTAAQASVDVRGCSSGQLADTDGDGVVDGVDACPGSVAGVNVDAAGCSIDQDADGVNDDVDQCPGSTQPPNAQGCDATQVDTDNDGVNDAFDQCPNTSGTANGVGCAAVQLDTDNDGVNDAVDQCPGSTQSPNSQGCDSTQVDTDNDGINDAYDQCANTNGTANAAGCAATQLDTVNDGVNDDLDQCPNTVSSLVGQDGCAVPETDSDGDGIPDHFDNTPTQCVDVSAFDASS